MNVIETFKSRLAELATSLSAEPIWQELQRLFTLLRQIEDEMGLPGTDLRDILQCGEVTKNQDKAAVVGIVDFEFAGMRPLDAAKAFLRKARKIVAFEEIVTALKRGGRELTATERDGLLTSLTRSTVNIFKVRNQAAFGLLEFVDNKERGRKKTDAKDQGSEEVTAPTEFEEGKAMGAAASESH